MIAGYMVQNVCVEVHFGKYHEVDSSETAFQTAARWPSAGLREGPPVPAGTGREDGDHGPGEQGRRRLQRHVQPRRPRAGQRLGRRQPADRQGRSPAARSHHLRPHPVQHDRRPGQLHDGVQPLRRHARPTSSRKSWPRPSCRRKRKSNAKRTALAPRPEAPESAEYPVAPNHVWQASVGAVGTLESLLQITYPGRRQRS